MKLLGTFIPISLYYEVSQRFNLLRQQAPLCLCPLYLLGDLHGHSSRSEWSKLEHYPNLEPFKGPCFPLPHRHHPQRTHSTTQVPSLTGGTSDSGVVFCDWKHIASCESSRAPSVCYACQNAHLPHPSYPLLKNTFDNWTWCP